MYVTDYTYKNYTRAIKVAENIAEEMNAGEYKDDEFDLCIEDNVLYETIFNDDKWDIMAHYQSPENANFNKAYEAFYNEVNSIVKKEINCKEEK